MKSGIYTITSPSGRCYVGSAVNFAQRWKAHRHLLRQGKHHSIALQRAFDKYGEAHLLFAKLLVCAKADLLFYEQRCIDAFGPRNLYNRSPVAGSRLGLKQSEAFCANQSRMRKGVPKSPEHVAKVAAANKGKKRSSEIVASMSAARANKPIVRTTSGFAGVSRIGDRWQARASVAGKRVYLGRFSTPEEANAAIQLAIKNGSNPP